MNRAVYGEKLKLESKVKGKYQRNHKRSMKVQISIGDEMKNKKFSIHQGLKIEKFKFRIGKWR
jgi:hypothetical protein